MEEKDQNTYNPTGVQAGNLIKCNGWWYYVDKLRFDRYDVSFPTMRGAVHSFILIGEPIEDHIDRKLEQSEGLRLVHVMDRLG